MASIKTVIETSSSTVYEGKSVVSNDSHRAIREDVSELKVPFDKVRDEINSTLTKGGERMKATETLYLAAADVTKTLEQKYANGTNEQKEWKDVKVKLAKTLPKDKVILNVGGDRYTTNIHTLTRESDTYFTDLFSGDWESQLDETDESLFIDRNGATFNYILEYLRTDVVCDDVLQDEILRHNLMIEAKYFRSRGLIDKLPIFEDGTLLNIALQQKLGEFYGKQDQRWRLIYKASRDGFDANAFHTRCDNKGPTITVVQSNNGYLFGGYTAVAWTSDGSYKNDTAAFLFTLTNPNNIVPTKYLIKPGNTGNAVNHTSSYGPTFGSGHDLYLAANSNSNNSSYTNFPHAYDDTTGHGNNTFTGAKNFTASDIEVYKQI